MRTVAIIGAGELGGAVAHTLARRNVVETIRLVDENGRVAEGKALDLMQAAPVEGFSTALSGSTDVTTAAGAGVIVIADRAGATEWQGDEGALLLKRLALTAPHAVLLCAGTAQRELVDYGVRELGIPPARLFGSAPEALASAARALVALAVDGSPRDVSLSLAGVPPADTVVPWEDATIAGYALTRTIDAPRRRQIVQQLAKLWPLGPHVLAAAATRAVEIMAGRSRAIISCFVAPESEARHRTRTVALPVVLGGGGIARTALPALNGADKVALDNAMML